MIPQDPVQNYAPVVDKEIDVIVLFMWKSHNLHALAPSTFERRPVVTTNAVLLIISHLLALLNLNAAEKTEENHFKIECTVWPICHFKNSVYRHRTFKYGV